MIEWEQRVEASLEIPSKSHFRSVSGDLELGQRSEVSCGKEAACS